MDTMIKTIHTLQQRGIPEDSYFTICLSDDVSNEINTHTEHDTNWSENSEQKVVEYFGVTKRVALFNHKIQKIHVQHGTLSHDLEIPDDCQVYQAIRSETTFYPTGEKRDRIIGRVVGLVKNDKVIEEYFLNGIENEIRGMKS